MAAGGIKVKPSLDPSAVDVAVDIGSDGKEYQLEQPVFGPTNGAKTMIDNVDGQRLPVGGSAIGLPGETAPTTDTASSGLNGRLQRIAQRLTTIFGAIGDTADAVVAAGAAGSIAAKLRTLTGYAGGAITATPVASGTADAAGVAALTSNRLFGFSCRHSRPGRIHRSARDDGRRSTDSIR
jgi:hypothetical protein